MSEIEHSAERDFETVGVHLASGFRVSPEFLREATADSKSAAATGMRKTAERLIDSLLSSWKEGDGEIRVHARFICSNKEHKHETGR